MNPTTPLSLFFQGLLCLILLLSSAMLAAQQAPIEKRDSLHRLIPSLEGQEKLNAWRDMTNIYYAATTTAEQLDTLFALYDEFEAEAIRQQNITFQAMVKGNRIGALRNMNRPKELIENAPACLDFMYKHEVWKFYYPVYKMYIEAKINIGQLDDALQTAKDLQAKAMEMDQQDGIATALQSIAHIFSKMSRHEESVRYYKQAIEVMDEIEPVHTNLPLLYHDLCQSLLVLKRYEEVQETLKGFEKANLRWEEHTGMKEYPSKMNLLMVYARLYVETGRLDEAEVYCNRIDSIGGVRLNRVAVSNYRKTIYIARKEYDKAIEMIDLAIEFSSQNRDILFSSRLLEKARILSLMGQAEESFNLAEASFLLRDSIRNLDINKQLDELRTQYEVDRHILEKQRSRNYFYFALTGCALLIIALAIWILYSRRLRAKNRVLYEQIQARNQCRIITENTLIHRPKEELSRELNLYRELSLLMNTEKLFTDPALDRRMLAERLGTNEKYIADAIHAGSQETLSAYITRLRLQYATELLDTQSDLTFEAIATEVGFASYPPFYRSFSKAYGMTPRDYRLLALANSQ